MPWCHLNGLQLPGDQFAAFVIFWQSHPIFSFLLFSVVRPLECNLVYYLEASREGVEMIMQSTERQAIVSVCARAHAYAYV